MSRPFPIKTELNSIKSGVCSNKNTNQKIFEIEKDFKNKYEKVNDDFSQKENMNSSFIEGELYIKEINPENHEFAKSEINPEETFHLKLNYSFQGRSKDSYSLSDFPMVDKNPLSSLNGISVILCPNNSMNESGFYSSGENYKVPKPVEKEKFIIEKKGRKRKARKYNADNIRKKIMRSFYRNLRMKLNKILKKSGCKNYFDFFPNKFASDINKKSINGILNKTLNDIFLDENLYESENKDGKEKYEHNSRVVKSEEIKNNAKIQNILNKTFSQLYEDYINSDKFMVDEINRLKRVKKQDNNYIERYINIAQGLKQFLN